MAVTEVSTKHTKPSEFYRGLMQRGHTTAEAARMTAYTFGLPVLTEEGKPINWKLNDVTRLLFLADLLSKGRIKE